MLYVDALTARIGGSTLQAVRSKSPFLLRTVEPPLSQAHGKRVERVGRIGKRVVFHLEGGLALVVHLMVSGRLRWKEAGAAMPGKIGLAAFDFDSGTLILTEAGKKKRASLHVVRGEEALADFDRGGLDVFAVSEADFAARLRSENHTLKRSLTDPRMFDGIGNAYSDEILHAAGLSPIKLSQKLGDDEITRLYEAARAVLRLWIDRLQQEAGDGFPTKVTAFRPEMAVHGKFGEACPACTTSIQRIRYADNETNYCPTCQTGGKLLADRSLSRLLKKDWPRSLAELEEFKARHR